MAQKRLAFIVCQEEHQDPKYSAGNGNAVQIEVYHELRRTLKNIGFSTFLMENRVEFGMLANDISTNVDNDALVLVWYAGHGDSGGIYGVNGQRFDMSTFVDKLSTVHVKSKKHNPVAERVTYVIVWECCRTTSVADASTTGPGDSRTFSPERLSDARPCFYTVFPVEKGRSAIGGHFAQAFIKFVTRNLSSQEDLELVHVLREVAKEYSMTMKGINRANIDFEVSDKDIILIPRRESPVPAEDNLAPSANPAAAPSSTDSFPSSGQPPGLNGGSESPDVVVVDHAPPSACDSAAPSEEMWSFASMRSRSSCRTLANSGQRKIAAISVAVVAVALVVAAAVSCWYLASTQQQPSTATTTTTTTPGCAPMECGGRCGECAEQFFCSSHGRCTAKYGCCVECGLFPAGRQRVKTIADVVANNTRCAWCMDHSVAWLGDKECHKWHESLWPGRSVKITMSFSWYQALSHPNDRRRIVRLDDDDDGWSTHCGDYGQSWSEVMQQALLLYAEHLGLQPAAYLSSA